MYLLIAKIYVIILQNSIQKILTINIIPIWLNLSVLTYKTFVNRFIIYIVTYNDIIFQCHPVSNPAAKLYDI